MPYDLGNPVVSWKWGKKSTATVSTLEQRLGSIRNNMFPRYVQRYTDRKKIVLKTRSNNSMGNDTSEHELIMNKKNRPRLSAVRATMFTLRVNFQTSKKNTKNGYGPSKLSLKPATTMHYDLGNPVVSWKWTKKIDCDSQQLEQPCSPWVNFQTSKKNKKKWVRT